MGADEREREALMIQAHAGLRGAAARQAGFGMVSLPGPSSGGSRETVARFCFGFGPTSSCPIAAPEFDGGNAKSINKSL
jgi:hypothetical protein